MRNKQKDQSEATAFAAPATASSTASRTIAPLDIQQKEFRVSRFGGYKMRDVDEFLDQVTDAMTSVMTDNERLRRSGGGASPVVGTADLADVNRQADEIIQRARDEAGRITAEAREQAASLSATGAVAAAGGASPADRAAINAFLAREKEFLQSLAGLVQGHAETVKSMAKSARTAPAAPIAAAPKPAPQPPQPTASPVAPAPKVEAPARRPEPEPAAAPLPARTPTPEPTMSRPPEEPVRVEEPEPASVGRAESDPEGEKGDNSLRELFWGED